MNKKLLALLATGALIITGCATKGNVKNKEDDWSDPKKLDLG